IVVYDKTTLIGNSGIIVVGAEKVVASQGKCEGQISPRQNTQIGMRVMSVPDPIALKDVIVDHPNHRS
ncbi:MAG TPA: hypothetical protein DHW84_00905, partial [Firmicutes bacterium]|nr:hypothetical protein [Bacillota bacterium]